MTYAKEKTAQCVAEPYIISTMPMALQLELKNKETLYISLSPSHVSSSPPLSGPRVQALREITCRSYSLVAE